MSDNLIVTNNTIVLADREDCMAVSGDFLEVLIQARDLIYTGKYRLISHPLPASSRMFLTPIRSIILSREEADIYSMELIQQCIDSYQKTLGHRQPDNRNRQDYERVDHELLLAAMAENKRLSRFVQENG